jgi:hypothetical protein
MEARRLRQEQCRCSLEMTTFRANSEKSAMRISIANQANHENGGNGTQKQSDTDPKYNRSALSH